VELLTAAHGDGAKGTLRLRFGQYTADGGKLVTTPTPTHQAAIALDQTHRIPTRYDQRKSFPNDLR